MQASCIHRSQWNNTDRIRRASGSPLRTGCTVGCVHRFETDKGSQNSRCSGGALGECACRCACVSAHMRMYAGARAREFARGWRMLRVRGSARTQNHRSLDGLAEVLEVYPPWCCKRISEQLRVPVQWSMSLCRLGGRKLRGMANHVRTCSRAAPPPRGTCEWRWRAIKVSPRGHPAPASQTIRLPRDQNEDACQPGM